MSLTGLLDTVLADPALAGAVQAAGSGSLDITAPEAMRPFAVAALAADRERGGAARPVLAVTATTREADDLA
ncbi:MAG: transcription-repair coupling factor, partial [Actinomycetia bacterium]|nr:transcription-repair coupling factor [Actinomycetes bacterium]